MGLGHDTAVQRTAPIAIAPKPPRPEPAPCRQNNNSASASASVSALRGARFEIGPAASLHPGQGALTAVPVESFSASSCFPASAVEPACQACRFSGARCAGGEDEDGCSPCQTNGVECSLGSPSPQTRKRKLNGDFSHDGGKRGSPGNSGRRQQNPSLSSSLAASSSFLEDMANVGGPTMLKRTLGLQEDRYSQYIGPTTDFEPSLINLSPFDPHDESLLARGTLRKVSDDDTFLMLPDHTTPGFEHVHEDLDAIEGIVAPHGRKLIDLFFKIVHPGLPIIQKGVFLEKYERSHREFSPPILAVVYLLAINWWDHSEELSKMPRPDVRELEKITRAALEDAMFRPKLSTIQAGLLLSQKPDGDQWAPTAQLVAIAQELGLHLDCSAWKIPPWEKGLRRRLAWALYMQDKWGSLVHGRPSHIFASNWAVRPLKPNDFPDVEWDEGDEEGREDVEKGRLVFMRFVQLSEILAEILDTFYTLQALQDVANTGPQATHFVLSLAKPIQLKLKDWYSGLPANIRLDSYSASRPSQRLSCIGYLHLGYFAAEITLHRRIIRSLAASAAATATATATATMPIPAAANDAVAAAAPADSYVQHICRSAAKARLISAMDFVNRLTPNHLRSFWYFASKTNFALIGTFGSLLWATSPGREEADWYRRRLGEYRWTLSVSSKPAGETAGQRGLTEFAMTMLDISTGLLKQLPEKPSMSRTGSTADLSLSMSFSASAQSHSRFGSGPGSFSGGASVLGSFSNLASADVSGVQSPESELESSDGMDDDYATPV